MAHKLNVARMALQGLQAVIYDDDASHVVLSALRNGILASNAHCAAAERADDHEWSHYVVDAECEKLENLLGVAYVMCQAQITAVKTWAHRVLKHAKAGSASTLDWRGHTLLALGPAVSASTTVTRVELIWALANYFKHSEEWTTHEWSKLNGRAKQTAETLVKVGIRHSSGVLRTGAEILGNAIYSELLLFSDHVDEWSQVVLKQCKARAGV